MKGCLNNARYFHYIPQALTKKDLDYQRELQRLAEEKIAADQRLEMLKQEIVATWEHVDFTHIEALLARTTPGTDVMVVRNSKISLLLRTKNKLSYLNS